MGGAAAVGDGFGDGAGIAAFFLGVGVVDGDPCALGGEREGDGAADASAGTGDQGGAASEVKQRDGRGGGVSSHQAGPSTVVPANRRR